jgi:hypothetical protein
MKVGAGRSRWLQAEDEVQLPWQSLEDLAVKLLEELTRANPLTNPHGILVAISNRKIVSESYSWGL